MHTHNPFSIAILILSLLLSGCSHFLDEYSQDERKPSTTGDYSEILFGEGYFKNTSLPYRYLALLSDDVTAASNLRNRSGEDTRQVAYGYYTWQANPEVSPRGTLNADMTWEQFYHQILTANVVLAQLKSMVGTDAEKAQLEGEAYAIKLNAYFMLTNIYGQPYTPATAGNVLGVPINNHSYSEDTNFPRATVKENYQEMIHCLESALKAFERSENKLNTFRWNAPAVCILGSRLYLYMQDWDNAIKYADLAIRQNPNLYDLNSKAPLGDDDKNAFISKNNKEICFQQGFYQSEFLSIENLYYFTASQDLLDTYQEGDLRYYNNKGEYLRTKKVRVGGGWFAPPTYKYFTQAKKNGIDTDTHTYGYTIRTSEAYLNRAEAYAQKGETQKAMQDLNHLRAARIRPDHAQLQAPSDQAGLIQLVRDERRRELCFEFHRWFDLRRWDQPSITHSYITSSGKEEVREDFTLNANDPRYTLPIPRMVLNSDKALTTK